MHFEILFYPKYIIFELKITEELCFMPLTCHAISKEISTGGLKNDIRNLVNFHATSRKSKVLHFDRLTLFKAYKVLDEKIQKSYVSRLMSLYSFPLPLVPQVNPSFPKVSNLPPPRQNSFQTPSVFLLTPLFWGYLKSQVRINKLVNSLDYQPCRSKLASRIHPYFNSLGRYLSPECLFNFLSNFYIPPCIGKIFKFTEFKFLENALIRGPLITHTRPHSKIAPKFLSSRPR